MNGNCLTRTELDWGAGIIFNMKISLKALSNSYTTLSFCVQECSNARLVCLSSMHDCRNGGAILHAFVVDLPLTIGLTGKMRIGIC